MPFNENWDVSQPPFVNGIATLTHEECVYVKTNCEQIIASYEPTYQYPTMTDDQVISAYNTIDGWRKAINWDTYNCIRSYNPEVNTLGMDETGIVQPVEDVEAPSEEETEV